jgi:hypothetical protein
MKLLIEQNENLNSLILEDIDTQEKKYFVEGIFIQTNIKNRNGRVYPKQVIENNIAKYQQEIKENRALGELGHPDSPSTNLDKVSHLIESLKFDGDNVIGKARMLDTPMGKIAKTFIKEGIKLGVSTRGTGSVKNSIVQNDFNLISVDIVSQPSAPDAWVNSIMENKEWVYQDGLLVEKQIEDFKTQIDSAYKNDIERTEKLTKIFNKYLKSCN